MAKKKADLPLAVLPDLLAWWRKTKVPGVIIGGLAVAFRGQARTTTDVDAIIFLDERRWAAFVEKGEKLSFHPRIPDALPFARESRVLLMHHEASDIDVDLSLGCLEIERQILQRAGKIKVGRLSVPVASAEDLIVLKAIANRPQDTVDIDGILDRSLNLDLSYVRKHIEALACELETPELMSEFERLLQHKQRKRAKKK